MLDTIGKKVATPPKATYILTKKWWVRKRIKLTVDVVRLHMSTSTEFSNGNAMNKWISNKAGLRKLFLLVFLFSDFHFFVTLFFPSPKKSRKGGKCT